MADLNSTPGFVGQLCQALRTELDLLGFPAKIDAEAVPHTPRYRFFVESRAFDKLPHSERQAMVWQIAQRVLSPEDQLRVSMILTLDRAHDSAA
jgi:hypothetical protein